MKKNTPTHIPETILGNLKTLKNAGFEAFLVGGCTRDIFLDREPKDWDITTNATPEQIQGLFPKTFYENTYGTVGVVNEGEGDKKLAIVEITPYRIESMYSDNRHPDAVRFSDNIHDDLKRRDFTVNAIAFDPISDIVVDDFEGIKDIESRTLRSVGVAAERFREDGLRVLRAVRLASELGFTINNDTEKAILEHGSVLKSIANERIRDEFTRLTESKTGGVAITLLQRLDILKYVIPELEEGLHMKQTQAHKFGVFEHLVRSFQCAIDKEYSKEVRMAALFHDIGKPRSRRFSEEKKDYTFYGHEVIGAKMTKTIMERLKFSRETIELVTKLVRWHMFFSDTNQITLSAVRRMIANIGKDHIWDLVNLRVCDRVGTGVPKEDPYRLRKYIAMIEEVLRDPISVGMLKIDGNTLIKSLGIEPGPRVGFMLNILLEDIIEDPSLNTEEYLVTRATKLNELDINELKRLSEEAKSKSMELDQEQVSIIRDKHRVK